MKTALQSPELHRYVHFLFLINPYNTIPKITVIDPAAIPTPISSITTFSFCAKSFSETKKIINIALITAEKTTDNFLFLNSLITLSKRACGRKVGLCNA